VNSSKSKHKSLPKERVSISIKDIEAARNEAERRENLELDDDVIDELGPIVVKRRNYVEGSYLIRYISRETSLPVQICSVFRRGRFCRA
jgi:hypothetical protein